MSGAAAGVLCAAAAGSTAFTTATFRASDGVALQYLEAAPARLLPGAREIVLIPGWTMPAWIWSGQLARLGGRHRVVALDPRAQGGSRWRPGMDLSMARRAADVRELIGHLGCSSPVVVGWSLGAVVAAQWAHAAAAGAVGGLVLVDQALYRASGNDAGRARFVRRLRADRRGTMREFIDGMFRGPAPGLDRRALLRDCLRTPLDVSVTLLGGEPGDLADVCAPLRVPMLVLLAPRLAEQGRSFSAACAGAQVETMEGCGHALFIDAPDRFAARLEQFIGEPGP